jgi:hypothetical protein
MNDPIAVALQCRQSFEIGHRNVFAEFFDWKYEERNRRALIRVLEAEIGKHTLEYAILFFKLIEPADIRGFHTVELGLPLI